ncbi:peptidoglycan-binding protein [Pyxidicoccus parkwayensis]|uniref:Peptidoglycan-binding protein n=1 Tax=Pyxidicoccus parkwayensis TaxID=2813578 RepID=A0ABX7NVV1_9BACT|nr:peptidoglycan-binding protein [Pyxidicoccus parkwaysis]QSQ22833.1 peptidoglycan-binding protein [Pyxidicoccus parkwaysis]
MRVDGSSPSIPSPSSQDTESVQRNEAPEPKVLREEDTSQSTGHDDASSFEEESSSSSSPKLRPPPPPPPPEPPPPEPWPVPEKDLKRGDSGKDVQALQDSLVELGYLTQEQVATGPGQFGPKTQAALEKFQKDHGLPTDGHYEARTREALSQALNSSHPAGAKTHGAAMSAEAAFITQFTSEYNPYGPRGSTNCGPASLAMSLAYTGHMPPGLTKEQQVDHARALMSPRRESEFTYVKASDGTRVPLLDRDHELTGGTMVADGIKSAGLTARYGQGWEALDQQLAAGNPVIANGATNASWRAQFPERMGNGDIGHLNAILGKTQDGKYLVADPLHTGGPVAMTRQQLSVFFSPTGGQPSFNALQGASRGTGAAAAGASAGAAASASAGAAASTGAAASAGTAASAGAAANASAGIAASAGATTASLPPRKDSGVVELLRNAATGLPVPEPGISTASTSTKATAGTQAATGSDPKAKAQQDAKALETTLQRSMQDAARQFEQLVISNPDPAYQQALVEAAKPSLEKMGDCFDGVSPETDRQLHPPKPQQPPDLNDKQVFNKLAGQETNIKYQTFYNLARAAEAMKEPAAGKVGELFVSKMQPGFTQSPVLLSAVRNCIQGGVGSRLAVDMERGKDGPTLTTPNSPRLYGKDVNALHETIWKSVDTIRADFTAAADKAEAHQAKLTELLSGPARVLTPEQQQKVISTFMTPERQKDVAEYQRLGTLLAKAAPDGVPATPDDPRVTELARALPRLAETDSGAEYLASQLDAKGQGRPVFFDVVSKLKDGKDFDEKLAVALVKSAGRDAIKAASLRDVATAKNIYEGLAQYAHLYGMKPDDMRRYTSVLQTLKPNMPPEQYRRNLQPLDNLLRDQSAGLIGNPESHAGQALRGLGVVIATSAFLGDATQWSDSDVAARIKIVGDGLSVGGDGMTWLHETFVKGASACKGFGRLSAVGAILGVVGDTIQTFQAVKAGHYFSAGASGAQALGGAILAASAFVSVAPGLQLLGAALFAGGVLVKTLNPDQLILRGQQVDLLAASGMDRKLAETLVHTGPDFLDEKLGQGLGMSPGDIQKFLGEHLELEGHRGYIDTLAQAAGTFGMTGANFQRFIERLAKTNDAQDLYALGDRLHSLFFGQPPSMDADGSYPSQAQRFRNWVETSYPDLISWVDEQHRKAAAA